MTRARDLSRFVNAKTVDTSLNVGIGTTIPRARLDVVGVVSATSFYGDGTNLSNTGSTLSAASGTERVVLTNLTSGTMTASSTDAALTWNSTTGTLSATNVSVAGTLTYEDVTNVDSVGLITARNGAIINAGTATTALIVEGDARVTGILTVGTSSITLDGIVNQVSVGAGVTLDGTNNQVNVGTGVTLHHTNGVQVGGNTVHSTGLSINQINVSGVVTSSTLKVGTGGTIITTTESGFVGIGTTNPQGTVQIGAGVTIQGDSGIVRAANFYGSGANLSNISVGDGTITAAKIVSNATNFDLNRKKLYLPRGHFEYGQDASVPSGTTINGHPYGSGFSWYGYYTDSGYVANGATVNARNINNSPNGIIIIEMSRADAGGGPYGNHVSGHEIWSVNTAHHGFSGGSANLIQSSGTLHGSYTTGSWYNISITGSTGGTYYRVTFIN